LFFERVMNREGASWIFAVMFDCANHAAIPRGFKVAGERWRRQSHRSRREITEQCCCSTFGCHFGFGRPARSVRVFCGCGQ